MDTKVHYTYVGLFVIALSVACIAIFLWLTAFKDGKPTQLYVTYLHEEVSGLSVQSPVRFNGVKVGYVKSIQLNAANPQQVKILMSLAKDIPITTATIAILTSEGITGVNYIGLKALSVHAPLLTAKAGQIYPVIPSEPSLLMKLSTAVQEVTQSVTSLSKNMQKTFDDQNQLAFKHTLLNIEKISAAVAENAKGIDQSLKSANTLLQNVAEASTSLPKMMQQVEATLTAVRQLAASMSKASNGATVTMRQAESAMQGVSQHVVPFAARLLQQLNTLTQNLDQVSQELKINPAVLIRGKAQARLGPGEH